MKKLLASALCVALSLTLAPINLIAAGRVIAQTNGAISGIASVDGKPLGNVTVRLRNVDTGQLVGNMNADAEGRFSFTGLGPGNFIVETVAANGTILGTSTVIALTAAAMIASGITVGTSAAAMAAAGGAGAAAAGAAGAGAGVAGTTGAVAGGAAAAGAGLSATVVTVTAVGATLAATGVVVATNTASPSR